MNGTARWKIILVLIGIFAAGAVTGGLLAIGGVRHEIRRQSDSRHWVDLTMHRWKVRLRLTSEQEQQLRPIVQETVDQLRGLLSRNLQESNRLVTEAQTRVEPILNPEQRERLQKMREERRRRLQAWFNLPEPGD